MRATLGAEWTDGCEGEWPTPVTEHANTESVDLPSMEDAAELISKLIDLPADVIQGILHRGAKMVLGGGSKTFKTWTLIDLAISVATGTIG
jgi:RecA-family ATPase